MKILLIRSDRTGNNRKIKCENKSIDMDAHRGKNKVADPDPHYFWNLDPDPH
jgi:hypothetical protein